MNGDLRRAINVKGMLRRKAHKFNSDTAWKLFKAQRNKVTRLKRASMRKYFEVRCSGSESLSNSSEFWKTIGPFISDKDHSLVIRELPTLMLFFLKMIKLKMIN